MTVEDERASETTAFGKEHAELHALLKARIRESITSAAGDGRTIADPARAAMYAVDGLMEYPDGRELFRRIVTHLDRR